MHRTLISLVVLIACAACAAVPPSRPLITEGETIAPDEVDRDELVEWIRKDGQPPVDFLVGQFEAHDVVLLGETHSLRPHQQLVIDALAPLYERADVRLLCSEFIRASETDRVQAIIEAETWDEAAAIDVMRDGPWPTWGWREYIDIMEAAWRINATRPKDAPPFRIVGIDDDWTQLAMLEADRGESFKLRLQREDVMHESARGAIATHGPRAIVHIGAAHAVRHGIRLAHRLHGDHGDRMTSVIFHHHLRTRAGDSEIQALLEEAVQAAEVDVPVAFAVTGSPLARVREDDLPPMMMLGPAAAFEDFAPSLVYFGPPDSMPKGHWITGFVNEESFEEAREVAIRLRMIEADEGTTAEELDALLAERLASE
jgi:hypothetical protein